MARLCPAPFNALCVLCLCAAACLSPTPAAGAPALKSRHASAHGRGRQHSAPCAKRSSHHASGGHARHSSGRHHTAGCARHGSGSNHKRATPRKLSSRTGGHPKHSARRAPSHRGAPSRRATSRRFSFRAHRPPPRGGAHGTTTPPASVPMPVDGNCADSTLSPTEWNVTLIRTAVLCLVNRERADHGESPLAANGRLEQAAQAHTESMAFGDYFEHVGPRGETPLSRMRASGYIYSSQIGYEVGENIGWGTLWEGTPRAIVAAWMASPGHRANILDPRFRDTGVGVSPHPPRCVDGHQAGGLYTQDFGVIFP